MSTPKPSNNAPKNGTASVRLHEHVSPASVPSLFEYSDDIDCENVSVLLNTKNNTINQNATVLLSSIESHSISRDGALGKRCQVGHVEEEERVLMSTYMRRAMTRARYLAIFSAHARSAIATYA